MSSLRTPFEASPKILLQRIAAQAWHAISLERNESGLDARLSKINGLSNRLKEENPVFQGEIGIGHGRNDTRAS